MDGLCVHVCRAHVRVKSDVPCQGCWHIPAGADDEWLCIDVQGGLRLGLDRLMPASRRKGSPRTGAGGAAAGDAVGGGSSGRVAFGVAAAAAVGGDDDPSSPGATEDEKLKQVRSWPS